MILTNIVLAARQFGITNNVSFSFEQDSVVVAKMMCHDALHQLLNLHLSDDEMECEGVESDVLCVQDAIRQGYSLAEIVEIERDYIPGVVNLTEADVAVMHYFFNI